MGVQELAQALRSAMVRRNGTGTSIKRGTVSGNQVMVDGTWYPSDYSVDIDADDGEQVYVVLNDSRTKAVVIGK